jgi:hypothetical protein
MKARQSLLTSHVRLKVTLEVRGGGVLLGDGSGLRKGSEGEESGESEHSD